MAWLERRGQHFHINFRFGGQRFKKSLKTSKENEAHELATRAARKLRLIEQGDLAIPDGMDAATFVVSDGRLTQPVSVTKKLHLEELFQRYRESLPNGGDGGELALHSRNPPESLP